MANSQANELEKFLCRGYPDGRPPVTFRRYTGQENDDTGADAHTLRAVSMDTKNHGDVPLFAGPAQQHCEVLAHGPTTASPCAAASTSQTRWTIW